MQLDLWRAGSYIYRMSLELCLCRLVVSRGFYLRTVSYSTKRFLDLLQSLKARARQIKKKKTSIDLVGVVIKRMRDRRYGLYIGAEGV